MAILVRRAIPADVDRMVAMGQAMHAESTCAHLNFNAAKFKNLLLSAAASPNRLALVAASGEQLHGMLLGYVVEYFFGNDKVASDQLVYVAPNWRGTLAAKKLITAYRDWAASLGAKEVGLGTTTGVNTERTGRFYERLGFARVGAVYKWRA